MKPTFYFNLRVATNMTSRGPSGTAIEVLASTLKVVHGAAKTKNIVFASAFPQMRDGDRAHPGTVLRIFTGSRDDADILAECVEQNQFLSGYMIVGRIRPIPQGIEQSVSYSIFRISRKNPAYAQHRAKRLSIGDTLPHLKQRSKSTGQNFSLRFSCAHHECAASENIEPNSYGLSVATRAFTLPFIPDDPLNFAQ